MAASKRTDFAKVKVWMPHMTAEVEGTIAGVAIEIFAAVDGREKRAKVLQMMEQRHQKMCAQEDARQSA